MSVDAMTLFGVGLIAGGVALLGYAYVGTCARRRAEAREARGVGPPGRDWSALDRTYHRGFDRLRTLPFIRRSALLDETVPLNDEDTVLIPAPARADPFH